MHFKHLRKLVFLPLWLCLAVLAYGQGLTTGSMSGVVKTQNGEPLVGATVKAVHVPTGTTYGNLTNSAGSYYLPNMRVGGPYTVTIEYVGFKTFTQENIQLALGQALTINPVLVDESVQMSEVVISESRSAVISAGRTGAATAVTTQQLMELPTLGRSVNDFSRLSPQGSTGSPNFAGSNGKYNNFTLDGALVNNVFGLGDDPLPGSGAGVSPVSIDALDQISVLIAPYDVRQFGFTGGGINATTRSGTNEVSGSAYWFAQRGRWQGKRNAGQNITLPELTYNQYGMRVGGPIIKNKLFFFVSGELTRNEAPFANFRPREAGEGANNTSIGDISADSLRTLSNFLQSNFGVNFGGFQFPEKTDNKKLLVRLDWNLNENNKLSFRYNYVEGFDLRSPSASDDARFYASNAERSNGRNTIPFESVAYKYESTIASYSLEWNAIFGTRFANQLIATYSDVQDRQYSPFPDFPTVEIVNVGSSISRNGAGEITGLDLATVFGPDPFRHNNGIIQNQLLIQDNFSIFLGKHNITAGFQAEYYELNNIFLRARWGRYVFRSFDSFYANVTNARNGVPQTAYSSPMSYWLGYELDGRTSDAALEAMQLGFYAQDEYQALPNLKVTAGLRLDIPFYLNEPIFNQEASDLFDQPIGKLPGTQYLFSPRLGFNWDVFGNKRLQVRGGTGIFSGRIPFVWMTNNVASTGLNVGRILTIPGTANGDAPQLNGQYIDFDPNIAQRYKPSPAVGGAGTTIPLNFADNNFKWTQVWRSSLGVDYDFGNGLVATLEGAFTQDINAVYHVDANLNAANGNVKVGPGNAPTVPVITGSRRIVTTQPYNAEVIGLRNSDQGYAYFITAQLQKSFNKNFFISAAYTYTNGRSLTNNPGESANSAFQVNPVNGDPNRPQLGFLGFGNTHRFIATASYKFEYSKWTSTTIAGFYELATGPRYSFTYGGDLNNDGANNDLMYIPAAQNEIILVPDGGSDNRTANQIWQQLDAFINQDEYLSARRGTWAERNGAQQPMVGVLDLRILQDFYVDVKGKRNTIQLSLEIFNFGNLINENWGVYKNTTTRTPLRVVDFTGVDPVSGATGLPRFTFTRASNSSNTPQINSFAPNLNSRYRIQCGIRYIFN